MELGGGGGPLQVWVMCGAAGVEWGWKASVGCTAPEQMQMVHTCCTGSWVGRCLGSRAMECTPEQQAPGKQPARLGCSTPCVAAAWKALCCEGPGWVGVAEGDLLKGLSLRHAAGNIRPTRTAAAWGLAGAAAGATSTGCCCRVAVP